MREPSARNLFKLHVWRFASPVLTGYCSLSLTHLDCENQLLHLTLWTQLIWLYLYDSEFGEGRELKLERQVSSIIKYLDTQYADTMSEVRSFTDVTNLF
jgi:hypothetical protein